MTFHLTWMGTSASPVEIFPTWDFTQSQEKFGSEHRTLEGNLHTYLWGVFWNFSIPLNFVSSSYASELRDRWNGRNEVVFTEALSSDPHSVRCRMVNDTVPMVQREWANYDQFKGMVFLRESQGTGQFSGGPFLLNDPTWGKLDQSYNVLV